MFYPLLFVPIMKERIWGGQVLKEKYNRDLPAEKIGESWDVACHENGTSIVANGEFKGKSLIQLIAQYGTELLGTRFKKHDFDKFPLLIKLLDASDVLSVQVHPGDEYAALHEGRELGKTEMWYVIQAKPGAELVYGVKKGTTKEEFARAIARGDLEKYLNRIEVKSGDVVYIPSGTVHAIGAGILICEIQQNSDTTYRVYDWNRLGDDGKPRELHVGKALDVINFDTERTYDKVAGLSVKEGTSIRTYYVASKYFMMEKLEVKGKLDEEANGEYFVTLTVIEGQGKIRYSEGEQHFNGGDSLLIPASLGPYSIVGECVVIKAYVGDREKDIIGPLLKKGHSMEELTRIAGLFE